MLFLLKDAVERFSESATIIIAVGRTIAFLAGAFFQPGRQLK
jgi:hypothetical protein